MRDYLYKCDRCILARSGLMTGYTKTRFLQTKLSAAGIAA